MQKKTPVCFLSIKITYFSHTKEHDLSLPSYFTHHRKKLEEKGSVEKKKSKVLLIISETVISETCISIFVLYKLIMRLCFHNYYKTEIKNILTKNYIFSPILF